MSCLWIGPVIASLSACLPQRQPLEPAGTFALWLQFPGMSNLRQLLRTCYLRQQCASSAYHITRNFYFHLVARLRLFVFQHLAAFNSSHICICSCISGCLYCACVLFALCVAAPTRLRVRVLPSVHISLDVRVCLHLCELGLPRLHLEQH